MQFELNKASLKAFARRQHAALVERGIVIKLSDVLESLSVGFEHRNLAHLYGAFKVEEAQVVDMDAIEGWSQWVMYEFYDGDESSPTVGQTMWSLLPEGTKIDDVASADWKKVAALVASNRVFPEGFMLSAGTVVLETYVEASDISKYGMPVVADEYRVGAWVREELGFRVPRNGVLTNVHDRGDDGCNSVFVLLALRDEDAQYVRKHMFPHA